MQPPQRPPLPVPPHSSTSAPPPPPGSRAAASQMPQTPNFIASNEGPVKARISLPALIAMMPAIVGALASMFGGGVLGVVAIILGVIALIQIGSNPQAVGGKGYAWTGIGVGIGSIVLTAFIFFSAPRRPSR